MPRCPAVAERAWSVFELLVGSHRGGFWEQAVGGGGGDVRAVRSPGLSLNRTLEEQACVTAEESPLVKLKQDQSPLSTAPTLVSAFTHLLAVGTASG